MVYALSVIVVFKFAQIKWTYISKRRHALVCTATSSVSSPENWDLFIRVDEAYFSHSFEYAAFDCIFHILLYNKAFICHTKVWKL
jgi:hypothetical protein